MQYQIFGSTVFVRIDRGERVVESLYRVCEQEQVLLGAISGLGAVDEAEVGLYEVEKKYFNPILLKGEREMTSVNGNVTVKDGKPYLHLHATFADQSGNVCGGHLREAKISATAEIFIEILKGKVGRAYLPAIGIQNLNFEK